MKQIQAEFYENLTNKELIELAANCMSEIQNRPVLVDCLTEMTYIEQRDEYGFIYDKDSFYSFIDDFQKYLACRDEKVIENKSKRKWLACTHIYIILYHIKEANKNGEDSQRTHSSNWHRIVDEIVFVWLEAFAH